MAITTAKKTVRPSTRTASATTRRGPSSRVRHQSGTAETIEAPATTMANGACQWYLGRRGQQRPDDHQEDRAPEQDQHGEERGELDAGRVELLGGLGEEHQ